MKLKINRHEQIKVILKYLSGLAMLVLWHQLEEKMSKFQKSAKYTWIRSSLCRTVMQSDDKWECQKHDQTAETVADTLLGLRIQIASHPDRCASHSFGSDWQLQAFAGEKACKPHSDIWERTNQYYRKCSFDGGRKECLPGRCGPSVYMSVGLLGSHFTVCWWGRHRYGFTPLGRARPCCWQQVLFDVDVPCWVSALASTYDLNYDQRRNACWWMTGDSGQTGEGRGWKKRWRKANRWEVCGGREKSR